MLCENAPAMNVPLYLQCWGFWKVRVFQKSNSNIWFCLVTIVSNTFLGGLVVNKIEFWRHFVQPIKIENGVTFLEQYLLS